MGPIFQKLRVEWVLLFESCGTKSNFCCINSMAKIRVDGPILSPKLIKVGCLLSTKLGNLVKFAEILFVRLKNAPKTIFFEMSYFWIKEKRHNKRFEIRGNPEARRKMVTKSTQAKLVCYFEKEVVNNLKILNPSKGRANTCCTIQLKESLEFFIPGGHFTFKDQWKKIPKSKRRKLTWHKSSEFRLILT